MHYIDDLGTNQAHEISGLEQAETGRSPVLSLGFK